MTARHTDSRGFSAASSSTVPAEGGASRNRLLFEQTFGCLDVSDETTQRILAMAQHPVGQGHQNRRSGRRRITTRTALAAAAMAAVVASGAYAAATGDFFQTAFGPKGNPDVEARTVTKEDWVSPVTGEPATWTNPGQTWVEVDPQTAERLLGGYVEDVGRSISLHGYTLTIEQCVVDEHGNGVATYTLVNPDGVAFSEAGYGEVYRGDAPVAVGMWGAESDRPMWDMRMIRDAGASDGTTLRGAIYFGPFAGTVGEGLVWTLEDCAAQPQSGQTAADASAELPYRPASTVPATTLRSDSGLAVDLSPLSLVVARPGADAPSPYAVTIRYQDGSEYVVFREGGEDPVLNRIIGYGYGDGSGSAYLFNRLVDVDAVASVEVADIDGNVVAYTR